MITQQQHSGPTRPFTGRHMAAIMVGFFTVVIAVNVFMAREASATFGGVVVENSYVASQQFNRWLAEASNERKLGLSAELGRRSDGRVTIALHGSNTARASVAAVARHPLGRMADRTLLFTPDGDGGYLSDRALPAGRWRMRIEVRTGDGRLWRSEGDVR